MIKKVYEITLYKPVEQEETVIEKDSEGKEVKITKKVNKNIPKTYFIRKPIRRLIDEAAVFRARKESDFVKEGVLSSAQLSKRFSNDDGVLSEKQKDEVKKLYDDLYEKNVVWAELNKKTEKTRTKEENEKHTQILNEMVLIMQKIQQYDNYNTSLYSSTAESLAQEQTLRWWALNLSYEEIAPNQYKLFFGEGSYEDKLKVYDEIEEKEDPFEYEVVKKLLQISSLFILGKAEKKEDFDILLKLQDENEKVSITNTEDPPKTEDKPAPEVKDTPELAKV